MFEDSLFASSSRHYPQTWTALGSVALQSLFVATLIILPMLFTNPLPSPVMRKILPMPPLPRPVPIATEPSMQSARRDVSRELTHVPASLPRVVAHDVDPLLPEQINPDLGPPGLTTVLPIGSEDSQVSTIVSGRVVTPAIQSAVPKHWRVSGGVEKGLLLSDVKPIYPRAATIAGIQGEVVLQAVIGKDGRIENLHAVSGNPLLIKAALDAVQKWRYRPYMLNGQPVEVETQITVRFSVS